MLCRLLSKYSSTQKKGFKNHFFILFLPFRIVLKTIQNDEGQTNCSKSSRPPPPNHFIC